MYRLLAAIIIVAICVHQSQGQCTSTNCVGPACRCMSATIPGGLAKADTPQLVFLAFDGAITTTNHNNYTYLLNSRYNPNGCPVGMTFFIFHEYNDYTLTHDLYFRRQEIATHTISHTTPSTSWANKTVQDWADEIGGMKQTLSAFANIPSSAIRGERAPFLQTSGDNTFIALKNNLGGAFYDVSFPTTNYTNPPVWPYTLDQGFQQECAIQPCPTQKYAGIWTFPMIALSRNGTSCSMADACASGPNTNQETYDYLRSNFERHYNTSKAPFGVYLTANGWFQNTDRLTGYKRFLDFLGTKPDVYIVPIGRGLDWMKSPTPLSQAGNFFNCPTMTRTPCVPTTCYYEGESSPVGPRTMTSCVQCPDVYPWTGNPLGTIAK